MTLEKMCRLAYGSKPALLMVAVQVAFTGTNVLYKLAINDGMNLRVMIAYRFIFASAIMVPLALIFERGERRKVTWIVFFQAFLCGLFGAALYQNLYLESLSVTSTTFVSAMFNLIPAVTFILAVSIGMEKSGLKTQAGKAKVTGTLIGIGGAMLLTFYKGAEINIWPTHIDLLKHKNEPLASSHHNFGLGALSALGYILCYALWLIIQAKMSARYPQPYSCTALMSVIGAILSVIFALCMENDRSQWKLGWNIRLLTVAYSGTVVSGLMVAVITWCVRMKGPLYVSIFNPLMLILSALAGSLLLEEKLHLGSVLGSVLIICGLYAVLWGKGKEMKKMGGGVPASSSKEGEKVQIVIISSEANNCIMDDSTGGNCSSNIVEEKLQETEHQAGMKNTVPPS